MHLVIFIDNIENLVFLVAMLPHLSSNEYETLCCPTGYAPSMVMVFPFPVTGAPKLPSLYKSIL